MNKKHPDISILLYNIRSCFNVGAIFRTADGAGIRHLFLTGITPAPPRPQIDKVSLGAETWVPFSSHRQPVRQIKKLKKEGYQILALEQSKTSIPYFNFKTKTNQKYVLILGAEVTGLPKKILDLCDHVLEIPMHGRKESLNVGIAGGIVLFDLIKN
jgi:23S rRNA (guanosine2251-2'-O)-methyltransferase